MLKSVHLAEYGDADGEDEDEDKGVYYFSLKSEDGGRLRLEDKENNRFTVEMNRKDTQER